MKYKLLALSIMTLGFVGCASHPLHNSKHQPLNQQIYHSYERLVSKESYAFDGKMTLKLDMLQQKEQQSTQNVAPEQNQRQRILKQLLQQPHKFNATQQQWLQDGVDQVVPNKDLSGDFGNANVFIQELFNRYYMTVDGVIDLKHGQMSFNPKVGYSARNAQAWIMFPMVFDLRQSKVYADISALSPLVTDPKYDGQYVVFDYAELLKKSNINTKPLLEIIREYMLVSAALTPEKNYQLIPLTDADKKIGAKQRIRHTAEYSEVITQYLLFFYLNLDYLKTILPQAEQLSQNADFATFGQVLTGKPLAKDLFNSIETTETAESIDSAVPQELEAAARYYDAVNELMGESDDDANSASEDARLAAEEATRAAEEATEIVGAMEDEKFAAFDKYKSDKLISAQQLQKIVAEQSEAYTELLKTTRDTFESSQMFLKDTFVNDLVLDAKGRLIRSEMNFKINDLADIGVKDMEVIGAVNFHSYGSAKVDQQQLKNAIPFTQAANENTMLKLGEKWEKLTKDVKDDVEVKIAKTESQSWSHYERYEKLVESLFKQQVSFLDTYATIYRYAYLLEGIDEDEADFTLEDLNDTARWTAIYYADENDLPLTAKEKAEYINSPDEWYYYDEDIAQQVWDIISRQQQQQRLEQQFKTLRKQGKTDAKIFSQLYLMLETEYEQKSSGEKNVKFDKRFLDYVKVLGEVAAEDMKTQKINTTKLKKFSADELGWFDADYYKQVYKLLIENPRK